jgi:inorganic pyrophosphatase
VSLVELLRTRWLTASLCALALLAPIARGEPVTDDEATITPIAAGLVRKDARTLTGPVNFLTGHPALAGDGHANAVIEVPTGYTDKWEVKNEDGWLHWDIKDGKPRRVAYLGYPCNYGMVPRTVLSEQRGGDGDPLDVLVLGEAVPRGAVIPAKVIGLLRMKDRGEIDVKLVAVRPGTPFAALGDVAELDAKFPGVTQLLTTWFTNYKGPVVEIAGFGDRASALAMLEQAAADFEAAHAAR